MDIVNDGSLELLLLSALFFFEGSADDLLHRSGEEDGVRRGADLVVGGVLVVFVGLVRGALLLIGRVGA